MMYALHILAAAGLASAATIKIDSGPGLVFKPDSVTAQKGDVLEFHFYPKNHSVAMGDFNNPCQMPSKAGWFSGYVATMDVESKTIFRVTVNNTDPMWYYCTQRGHCSGGMVGVVNPPASGGMNNMTLDAYKTASKNFKGMPGEASAAFGGEVTEVSGSSNSSGTATGSGSQSSSSPSGGSKSAASALQVAIAGVMGALVIAVFGLV